MVWAKRPWQWQKGAWRCTMLKVPRVNTTKEDSPNGCALALDLSCSCIHLFSQSPGLIVICAVSDQVPGPSKHVQIIYVY